MRKADYGDMWETRFLLFCVPLLMEGIAHFGDKPAKHKNTFKIEDVRERISFYYIYDKIINMLDLLNRFVNNKLISNIQAT